MRLIEQCLIVLAIASVCFAAPSPGMARQDEAPADLRALLEGTWELVEWHVDGEVLRPPQAGGRWSNHDGVVVATFHRETAGGFESFVGYGTYEMDASYWSYTYERVETASGPSSGDAAVAVRSGGEPRRFTIVRDGDAYVIAPTIASAPPSTRATNARAKSARGDSAVAAFHTRSPDHAAYRPSRNGRTRQLRGAPPPGNGEDANPWLSTERP